MRVDLGGKRFLVTGAAQGIGAEIARQLLAAGAEVIAVDMDAAGMDRLGDLPGLTRQVCDLGDRDAVRAMIETVSADGPVLGYVGSAGGVRGQVGGPVEEVTPERWRTIFEANVEGTLWCVQALAPTMRTAGWGRVVTISSGAGLRPSLTGLHAYCAAKHALVGLTRQLALDLGPQGITVNSIAPGFVLSNPSTEKQWDAFGAERQAAVVGNIHMRRLGRPEDIAPAVVFLASDQAGWISGQVLSVDGGHA
ncbi:SDR family NAD(P)-dependent oxidoreductase [Pararhodobacter sp. SW119]|uniref:SDR family NAD(P)-dependent oxidoreductase n=1 Tax=Pararhodobacter sp. SW119 TaxID=2780075 RepID=UPI001AE09137|nr:SDR family NAD(P)-dependent oxidoreductase [Pararhodobacter sp. SW119]